MPDAGGSLLVAPALPPPAGIRRQPIPTMAAHRCCCVDFNKPKKSVPDKNPTADKVIAFRNGIGGYRPAVVQVSRCRSCFETAVSATACSATVLFSEIPSA
jgi:hypothetical protein